MELQYHSTRKTYVFGMASESVSQTTFAFRNCPYNGHGHVTGVTAMSIRSSVKRMLPTSSFERIEPMGHQLEALLTQARYGFPARGLRVIGVTGSAGKTSTTIIIASILREAGYRVAYFTTAQNDFGDGKPTLNLSRMTTLQIAPLLRNIRRARLENNIDFLLLETTAHALQQGRVLGIRYELGVLTNFSHEHLDYFGTMDAYLAAKQKMFKKLRHSDGTAIINLDDVYAPRFSGIAPHDSTYGLNSTAAVHASDITLNISGSMFTLHTQDGSAQVITSLPGMFNVYNCLAAAATCLQLGVTKETIAAGVVKLNAVPGRMERYQTSAGFTVVIDFAHTPDSFEKLFKELRPITEGRIIALFGCAGERDKARRPIQGKLAAEYCEVIILTEDDPRSEDDNQIIQEITQGIAESTKRPEVIVDIVRESAIEQAVRIARKGDVVLLLSKGPERSIERADGPKPWDEFAALESALRAYNITLVRGYANDAKNRDRRHLIPAH